MEPNAMPFLNAQHCVTIAAGFIAIIAACATLITSANNKAESLTKHIYDAAEEHRRVRPSGTCYIKERQRRP